MIYHQYIPHPALRDLVKCYWTLESTDGEIINKDKILPDGCTEMIFHYHDLYRQFINNQPALQARSVIAGQLKKFIEIEPTGKAGLIAIRFYPHGLYPFLNVTVDELTQQHAIPLSDLFKESDELQEKILNALTNKERISIIEIFLLKKLFEYSKIDLRIQEAVKRIYQCNGNITIQELSSFVNLGNRQLERKFTTIVGLAPKVLTKIIRLQYALQLMQQKKVNNLTQLAHKSGYYDQSHFIKDFKSFSGINPGQYFSAQYIHSGLFLSSI